MGPIGYKKLSGVKIDIEKAYDTVSWNFLRHALVNLDFDLSFVEKLMFCATSPTYRILDNGSPSEVVIPFRGLRQGDPFISLLVYSL